MQKYAIGCFVFVVLAVFAVIFWLKTPFVNDPEYAQQVLREVEERFAARQRVAGDPEQNGFLNPVFNPAWGLPEQYEEEHKTNQVLGEFVETFSTWSKGEQIDLLPLLQQPGPKKIRDEFEALLPELQKVIAKPYFFPPQKELAMDAPGLNFLALRRLHDCLSGLAEIYTAVDDHEGLKDVLVTMLEFPGRIAENDSLMARAIALGMQKSTARIAEFALSPASDMTAEQWKAISTAFLDTVLPQEGLYHAIQVEFYTTNKEMKFTKNSGQASSVGMFYNMPGLWGREQRILENASLQQLKDLKAGNTVDRPHNLTFWNYLTGRVGVLSSIAIPSLANADINAQTVRREMVGIGLSAGILAFKKQRGDYPVALAELADSGISLPDTESLKVEYKKSQKGAVLTLPLDSEQMDFAKMDHPWDQKNPWMTVTDKGLRFEL